MALIQCDFFSDVLGMSMSMNVILPQETHNQIGMRGKAGQTRFPTLYLLHGLSDDHTTWCRRTSIERYVSPLGMAVVMPNVHKSFYTNMAQGDRYWDYISEEIPALARSFFPLSERREDNFAGGLSMGGYGAMKLGLLCPDRFAAVASLSGALDVADFRNHQPELYDKIFGNQTVYGTENDLFFLLEKAVKEKVDLPYIYFCSGTEDFLYQTNVSFRKHAQSLNVKYSYEEGPGEHNWEYWDMMIRRVLAWLPLEKK
ncbi:MAG: alpha/beta hydrolase [Bacillota bacterium]